MSANELERGKGVATAKGSGLNETEPFAVARAVPKRGYASGLLRTSPNFGLGRQESICVGR